jgi:hypothetical protein
MVIQRRCTVAETVIVVFKTNEKEMFLIAPIEWSLLVAKHADL